MKSTAVMLMIITVLSKIVGLIREKVMAYFFGTGPIARAIVTSSTIPAVLFGMIASGIATGFIPVYSQIEHEKGKVEADDFTSNLTNILFLITTIFVVLGLIFTEKIVFLFAPGYTVEVEMTVFFTRFAIITLYGTAWGSIFQGYLQLHGIYNIPASIGFVLNGCVISGMVLAAKTEQYWVIGPALLLGGILQYMIFLPQRKELNYSYRRHFNLEDPGLKELARIGLPVLLGSAVNDVNMMVDKSIASLVSVTGVASLNYANKIFGFVTGIVVLSISTTVYPSIVNSFQEHRFDDAKKIFRESIIGINILVIPAMVGIWIFSKEIVALLFSGGEFDLNSINETRIALFFYSFGLIGFGFRDMISKIFYARHEAKKPMINSLIVVFINIVLNIILSNIMGVAGLALASSIAISIGAIWLLYSLRKEIGPLGLTSIGKNIIKVLFATAMMALVSYSTFNGLQRWFSENLCLVVAVLLAVLVYGIAIYQLKIEGIDELLKSLRKKFRKSN